MRFIGTLLLLAPLMLWAQFDPAGGESGSLSVHKDDNAIYAWADSVIIERSWMDYADTSLGKVSAGDVSNAIGPANGTVVSLGDGGSATYYFQQAIIDDEGFEFAVFENGFKSGDGYFLELAFVEVSADGINYQRFPAQTIADTSFQFSNADVSSPTWFHNLAGKHQAPYGTLFDLDDVDLDSIHFVRIIDVIGAIGQDFSSRDANGRTINDSYPTAFLAGGFDIDALGLIKHELLSTASLHTKAFKLYPSLIQSGSMVDFNIALGTQINITNSSGLKIYEGDAKAVQIAVKGIYFLNVVIDGQLTQKKLCVY